MCVSNPNPSDLNRGGSNPYKLDIPISSSSLGILPDACVRDLQGQLV